MPPQGLSRFVGMERTGGLATGLVSLSVMMTSLGQRPFKTAREVWEFFLRTGNVRPKDYDKRLVRTLRLLLAIEEDPRDLGRALDAHRVSVERFMGALFRALEPFALMMSDLYEFLERHDVQGTGDGLVIRFQFDRVSEELTFDLKHFRVWLRVWENLRRVVDTYAWDLHTIWRIYGIFSGAASAKGIAPLPSDSIAGKWIRKNTYPAREEASGHWTPPPAPPPLVVAEVDEWVERIVEVIAWVVQSCSRFVDYKTLKVLVNEAQLDHAAAGLPGHPAPVSAWSALALQRLESDFFCGSLLNLVWTWVERLRNKPRGRVLDAARPVTLPLEELFGSIPTVPVDQTKQRQRLEEFLSLPVWKRRSGLYQAWLLPVIEKALPHHPVQIHHVGGILSFAFKTTRVATFDTAIGPVHLLAESRSALANPLGKGRVRRIQPDYILTTNIGDSTRTLAVIETKQYLRANLQEFANALTDYARGHPKAHVVLSDYGPISARILERIPATINHRVLPIGDVRPQSVPAIVHVQETIAAAIPPPPAPPTSTPTVAEIRLIIVDVSASMQSLLSEPAVIDQLHRLARNHPLATWIAVDTAIRWEGSGRKVVDAILALARTGATALAAALQGRPMGAAAILTDDDGRMQLEEARVWPRLLGVSSGVKIDWTTPTAPG